MLPPSAPPTNPTLSELVPERCLTRARPSARPDRFSAFRTCGVERGSDDVARQVFQCVGSALQLFPRAPERRHDGQGTKAPVKTLQFGRPSLAVNETAHVADSQRFLTTGPAVLKALAPDSQKRRSPVSSRIANRAQSGWGVRRPERGFSCATALT